MEELLREVIRDLKAINKRNFIIIIILIVTLFTTNAYWIWSNSQWEYVVTTTETQGGDANIMTNTGEGDLTNGESNGKNKEPIQQVQTP